MSSADRENEQRRSYRYRVPDAGQQAELKVRRRRVGVRLLNQSAGGFAVLAQRDLRVRPNDVLELLTTAGHFEVRVAYVSEYASKVDPGSRKGTTFRIGLQSVRELGTPSAQRRRAVVRCGRQSASGTTTSRIGVMAVLLVMVLIAAAAVMASRHGPATEQSGPATEQSAGRTSGGDPPAGRAAPSLAEVTRQLGLTEQQRKRIHDIARRTAETLQQLDAQRPHDSPQQRARRGAMLLGAVRREVSNRLGRPVIGRAQGVGPSGNNARPPSAEAAVPGGR